MRFQQFDILASVDSDEPFGDLLLSIETLNGVLSVA